MGAPADWSLFQNQGQLLARLEPITTVPDKTIKKIVFTDQPCIGVYMTVAGNLISATHITCTIFVLKLFFMFIAPSACTPQTATLTS